MIRLIDIINALNEYFLCKFEGNKGRFIAREYTKDTAVKAYKECKIDLYYHIPGKNYLALEFKHTDRCLSDEVDKFRSVAYSKFIKMLFENLDKLDKYGVQ